MNGHPGGGARLGIQGDLGKLKLSALLQDEEGDKLPLSFVRMRHEKGIEGDEPPRLIVDHPEDSPQVQGARESGQGRVQPP